MQPLPFDNSVKTLAPGDVIGVAAPSSRFDPDTLDKGVERLKSMGFRVRVPRNIYETQRYLAGSDKARARVLSDLCQDPEVKAVIAARGGYGAMRMLPFLDWKDLGVSLTRFIGFSDATALMTCLVEKSGLEVIHGPNLVSLADAGQKTLDGMKRVLTGRLEALTLCDGRCLVMGKARGRLLGGNLATLSHMVGTRFQPDLSGAIVFLEDVGEPAYKIDRMLTQMRLAGLFDRIRGVVTGDFTDCANAEYLPEIFMEIFGPLGVPVMTGLAAGHGLVNLAFPLGRTVVLDTDAARLSWSNGR
jgi:muramoyltetrapeptide carboxypeptidase